MLHPVGTPPDRPPEPPPTPTVARGAPSAAVPHPGTGHRAAAFFDVDNTVVRGASLFPIVLGMRRRGIVTGRDLLRFSLQHVHYNLVGESRRGLEDIRERGLLIIKGRSVAELVALGEEIYDDVTSARIWPGTRSLIDAHLAAGREVWFVTATPAEVAGIMAQRLGVTGALTTEIESENGVYTGRLLNPPMHARRKAEAIQELARERGLDLRESFAYGDSRNDIAMLSEVGHPCAVNPDRAMRATARRRGWGIIDLRARTSVRLRRARTTGLTAGALWFALTAARILVRHGRP